VTAPTAYTVRFTASARRDLERLSPRILSAVVEFAFGDLAREPHRVGKPLGRELAGQFSARRGPYRLLYRIDDTPLIVWVLRVDHRADVYRR
jgi:mRNA interferase RelE/StbE